MAIVDSVMRLEPRGGIVLSVAYNSDGTRVATASNDGTARIWDPASGEQLQVLKGHTDSVWSVAYNSDGTRVATAGNDGTARIWDPTNGSVAHWEVLLSPVYAVFFDPVGIDLATGHMAGARIWQPDGGRGVSTAGVTTPGVTLDLPAGLDDDHLDFRTDVDTFAALLADRETHQPLSIALFGDWGAGKSSFMHMLQQRIDELTGSNHPSFSNRVLHVEFNAWQYSDADLWASLATHVWDSLAADDGVRDLMRDDAIRRFEEALAELKLHDETVGRPSGDDDVTTSVRELGSAVGVSDPTVDQLEVWAGGARTLATRPRELLRVLRRHPGWTAAAVAFLVLAGILAFVAVTIEPVRGSLVAVAGLLTALFASASAVASATRPFADSVKQTLTYLGEAERDTRARLLHRLEAARNELERLDQIGTASGNGAQRRSSELVAITARAEVYRSELGVIHRVQHDFSQLVDLLATEEAGEKRDADVPDKIILYIDDLDRCRAKRVVEVLEAAHLLRDLFIVVVAVDPRWLERSLETQYDDLLRPERPSSGTEPDTSADLATPRDYLEKIFQISFGLGGMNTGQFGAVVRAALAAVTADVVAPTPQPSRESGADLSTKPSHARASVDDTAPTVEDQKGVADDRDLPEKIRADDREPIGIDRSRGPAPEAVALVVEAITVTEAEVRFLALLGPLVGTPRSARRLVNTYRLVRARSRGSELAQFRKEGHRSAAVLLAAALGYGEEARPLLERFATGAAASWDEALSGCEDELRDAFAQVRKVAAEAKTPVPDDIEIAQKLAPVIRRFSLRTSKWTTPQDAEDRDGSTESHHVAVAEAPDALTEFGPRDGGDPVDQ